MKLLFIGPNLGPGGAERQWSILVPGLAARGFESRVIALDGGGPFVEPIVRGGVPVEVLNMRHQADLGRLWRSRSVRDFSPDIVVSRGVSGIYVGHAIARLRRARHVFNEHKGIALTLSNRRETMLRLLARRIDLVVTVTEEQGELWSQRRFPNGGVVVVPNGVEVPEVSDAPAAIRSELGIPESAVVALMVARMRPEKRVQDFVAAVVRARRQHPELIGVVAGDGPERAAVEAAAGADAGIRLLGYRADIPRLLHAADMFVLTSEAEAAPMAILEAMAAGLPVVATDVGGVPSIVEATRTGLLVPPGDTLALADALCALAGDAQRRATLGAAGALRQRAHWSAESMIARYAQAFADVCGTASQTNQGEGTAFSS